MIFLIITSKENINLGSIDIRYVDGPTMEFLGYTFSLTGFSLFIYNVYNGVRDYLHGLLMTLSYRVLDVSE